MRKTLLATMTALSALVCAVHPSAVSAPSGQYIFDKPAAEMRAVDTPVFGSMRHFKGQKFVSGRGVLDVESLDDGNALAIGDLVLRVGKGDKLQVSDRSGALEKLKGHVDAAGALHIEGENWDTRFRYIFAPVESGGGFTQEIQEKSLAGVNFLSSWEYVPGRTHRPYTPENARAAAEDQAYRDRAAAQAAIEERAERQASDRAMANAFNAGMNAFATANAQNAQANARQNAMLSNINAQAEAQRQAQAYQAQQARQQAAAQQRQTMENNARWVAQKEQVAAQYQQAIANAQVERDAKRAEREREDQQRQARLHAESRERAQREQRDQEHEARMRQQDQQREARAQQQRLTAAQDRLTKAQQQLAEAHKAAPQARRNDTVASSTSSAPAGGKDLNCLTEGDCRKACPARDARQPSIFEECLRVCSRRSSCKVSYQ